MNSTNKEFLLDQAQQLLKVLDPENLETVQINSTTYDDGSEGLSIELTYPAEKKEPEKRVKSIFEGCIPTVVENKEDDSFTVERFPKKVDKTSVKNSISDDELITQWNFDSKTCGIRFAGDNLEFIDSDGKVILLSDLAGNPIEK